MLELLLIIAALPQGSNQARLHSADALVMVEIPDVTKMVSAYEKAPMMAMLHDAKVRESFYGMFEDSEFDFDESVSGALRKLGMPEAFAAEPMTGIRHYLDGIAAASFSLSVDRVALENFGPRAVRMGEIAKQVGVLTKAIEGYQGAAGSAAGTLPKDLAALGLESSAALDPWKHPYEYTVAADGTYALRSLGADGKPGGSGENADTTGASTEDTGEALLELLGFQTVIEFKNQVALEELRKTLSDLIAKGGMKAVRTGPFQMSGVQADLQSWQGPESELNGSEIWLMRAQNMLVLGGGRATPEAFAARLADPRVQTAADQFYATLAKNFGAASGATIIQGALHLADYASAFRKIAEAEGGETEMLDMMESMFPNASLRMQLVGERFVTEVATKYKDPKGIIAQALGLAPLPKELLSAVPDDAIGVYLSSMDGPLAWASIKNEFEKEADGAKSTQAQLAELETRYGFSVEKDIFGSVGKGVMMYLLPLKGVTSIPGMALVVDLKDPVAMQRGIEGLMAMLGDEVGDEFKIRSKPYHDAPVWTFTFGKEDGGGGMNPLMNAFSPSITIVKNRLIATLNSTHIKKEIKRAFGEEQGVHLIATEGHRPPEDATAFAYMDWAALLNGVYEGGRGLAGMMGGAGPLPVDVTKLPEPGVFTHFYKPTVYFSRNIPNGVYMRNESSFGPEVWVGLLGAGFLTTAATSESVEGDESTEGDEESMEEGAEVESAPVPPATTDPVRTQSTAQLNQLAGSLGQFRVDTGKWPADLDGLLAPTKSYPKGVLGQASLPKDGWGHSFKYALSGGGKRMRLWSMGPDGTDQQGAGDDILWSGSDER